MLRNARLLTVGLLACLAGACSTVTPEERASACAATDWSRYGQNDGRLGVPTSDRADEFLACQELGHAVDFPAYQAGRTEGLKTYCTLENGYRVGYDRRDYDDVCPPELERDFLQGYNRGRKDSPHTGVSPGIGIGIGTGGVRTRVDVGIGIGL